MKIGVLGAGQLGRMLALAGYPLGLSFRFFDPVETSCIEELAPRIRADYDDLAALARFAEGLDAVTYEFENVPVTAARHLEQFAPVCPSPAALEASQDRLTEKSLFRELGIATPPFAAAETREELAQAVERFGLPSVLKTRRMGYDGKGQRVLRTPADVEAAWEALGARPLILEGFVPFDRELSILAVRGRDGATAFYPLVENHHAGGILRLSLAPAPDLDAALQAKAEGYATRLLDRMDYVGMLALELFQVGDELLANEMAPRVHNSGHWTIEGAETSQFENHVRAVAGLPLGSTALRGYSAMVNLIGTTPAPTDVLSIEGAHLHLYGKEPRAGRKLGHITIRADKEADLSSRLDAVQALVTRSK
jgi:5-(carboxyamino)imidazole ribonucleotide synthase